MTREQIATAVLAFSLGFLLASVQTRRALTGWKHALDDNSQTIDMLETTVATLEKTTAHLNAINHTVDQLLAEKRGAWGLPAEKNP